MKRVVLAFSCGFLSWLGVGLVCQAADLRIQHHELVVKIDPLTHTLEAQDTIQLVGFPDEEPMVHVSLNPELEIEEVLVGEGALDFWEEALRVSRAPHRGHEPSLTRTIEIHLPPTIKTRKDLRLRISYQGQIDDPPRAAPGLRFVRPDKTNGHIGEEGVYLTSETAWYPHVEGSLATFHVRVTLPKEWRAVTQGREISYVSNAETSTAEWLVQNRTIALTLAANRFIKRVREWEGLELATYLFAEDDHLADDYLEAMKRYLEFYTEILGPYPFPKFAVVENFFPSGLGLPSFTLLGSRVIKRGYTQPYSLGHEIVHSWFGNSVLNRFESGNWVEGLTTYLANYLFDERFEGTAQAKTHRWRMIVEYSVFVHPEEDYPVVRFHHKENRIDNAVGYQKAAMIFHMLRRQIGEEAFFEGLRHLVAEYSGNYAEWPHLQRVFEESGGADLSWFFTQWIQQRGAPILEIQESKVELDGTSGYWIRIQVVQHGNPFRLPVPVVVELENGQDYRAILDLRGKDQIVAWWVPSKPRRVRFDPEYEIFRRLKREQIAPMLNLWVTDPHRAVSVPQDESKRAIFLPALDRIRGQEEETMWLTEGLGKPAPHSVLAFGGPTRNSMASELLSWCGPRVVVDETQVIIDEQSFSGDRIAALISCTNPHHPEHVGTMLFGFSPDAVRPIARLLFFYGWDSYLVFDNGRVIARGNFSPPVQELTVDLEAA